MKITDVRVDGFGVWSGLEVRDLSQNLTVFFGRNEAGKTTLMQFIRTVLYGFSAKRRTRYLPPLHGGAPGGSLRVASAAGPLELIRKTKLEESAKAPGELVIRTADGAIQGRHQLVAMTGDIDESIFSNVFAIGLRELQHLGSLNDTEAAEQLYKMTSGMDRVSLVDVMRKLGKTRKRLLGEEDASCEIVELARKRESLERELEELGQGTRRWTSLAAQKTALQREIHAIEQASEKLERESRLIELARQANEQWQERANITRRLEAMGAVAELPMNAIHRIGEVNDLLSKRQTRLDELMAQRNLVRDEGRALPINLPLWRHASRVEALCEHTQWIASLTNQIERIRPEVEEFQAELESQRLRTGLAGANGDENLPEINAKALATLKAPAKAVSEARQAVETAEQERNDYESELERTTSRYKRALTDRDSNNLSSTIADAQDQVDMLRNRIELEERLDKMSNARRELDEDRIDLMEAQVLHPHHHVICGAFVILGMTFFLASMFFPNAFGSALGVMGMIGGALASMIGIIIKYMMERSAEDELRECERELRSLDDKFKRAKRERDELDRQLPNGTGSLDRRLAEARTRLESLENMTPMESELHHAEDRFESHERQVEEAKRDLSKAQQRWRDALSELGLPQKLSPAEVRKLAGSFDLIRATRKQLEIRREELQARERELNAVISRIAQLFADVGLEAISQDPQEQLHQLSVELTDQRKLMDRRSQLKRQFRQLTKEAERFGRNIRTLSTERATLLEQAGVHDEDALRTLADRFEQFQSLSQDRERLNEQLASMIGPHFEEQDVAEVFSQYGESRLEPAWERVAEELAELQKRSNELNQELGAVSQEMKALTVDRRPSEVRLELDAAKLQLDEAVRQWQVLAVAGLLLESTRQIYETERQPDTLREASGFLRDLTDGQYTRVWTPLEQDTLMVDDSRGDALSVDYLSRGTRESVFLSLRLALASAYARRGAMLPLVLDDVLVNLDGRRATAAVRVLCQFASRERQVLLFTCHEHIVDMFAQVGAEVRELPRHGAVAGIVEASLPAVEYETPYAEETYADDEAEVAEAEVDEIEEEVEEAEPVADETLEDQWEEEDAEEEEEAELEDETLASDDQEEEVDEEIDEEVDEADDEQYEEEEAELDEEDEYEEEDAEYEEDEYEDEEDAEAEEEEVAEVDEYEEDDEYADDDEADEDEPLEEASDEFKKSFTWESPTMWNSSPAEAWDENEEESEEAA